MELKPTRKPGWDPEGKKPIKPLESIGAGGDNPWEVVNRGAVGAPSSKRRNWTRAALGATPPRDGPFQEPASGVAGLMPPKGRVQRQSSPWEMLNGRSSKRG